MDTENFLVAADNIDRGEIALLTELTKKLEGTERRNLLYGAAYAQSDPEEFLSQVEEVESYKRSEFLLSAANEGQDGENLKGLVGTAEKLVITPTKGPFASMKELVKTAKKFIDIFSKASATPTEEYLGTIIKTYA